MRKPVVVLLLLFIVMAIASCKKSTSTVAVAPSLYIPWNMDSLMPSTQVFINGVSNLIVNGVLVACEVSGSLTDTGGNTNLYSRSWEGAVFGGATNSLTAGVSAVSVNAIPLSMDTPEYFLHNDAATVWNDGTLNHWAVSGSDTIPSFSADVAGVMPVFTGALPVNISRTADFSFTFNSSNTANGDSAFVIIYGNMNGVDPIHSNVVSANGGTAIISAGRLSYFQNSVLPLYFNYPPTSPLYYGGIIMLVIYNHTIQTIGGKQFAFVKQREILGVIKFI